MWFGFRVILYILILSVLYSQVPWRAPHLHQPVDLGVISAHASDVQLVQKAVQQWSQHLPFQAFRVHRVPYRQRDIEQAYKNKKALISFVPRQKPLPWSSQTSWSHWLKKLNTDYRFHHNQTDGQTRTVYNVLGRIQNINIFVRNELQGLERYFVVLHELGHAIGLEHSASRHSVMHAYLGAIDITPENQLQLQKVYAHVF